MRIRVGMFAALLCAGASAAGAADLAPEKIGVAQIPANMLRVYVADPALPHMVDGRIYLLDGATMQLRGMMESGFAGMMVAAPDKGRVYVATSFYERLSRGKRTDVIQVFDDKTMKVIDEIAVPDLRAQALPYRNLMQANARGDLLFLQNATPSTSVTVVDLGSRANFEAQAAGCYGIYPAIADPLRFSTLCGDGTAGTYTIAADRKSARRASSDKFFEAQEDALYTHAERDNDAHVFLSYGGKIARVSFEGETARLVERLDLMAGQAAGWAPGGLQPIAFDRKAGVAYVLMHPDAKEGSHKNPSAEIWAYDVRGKKLLARSPAAGLIALTLSPGGAELFAINGVDNKIAKFSIDAQTRNVAPAGEIKIGETAALIEVVQ